MNSQEKNMIGEGVCKADRCAGGGDNHSPSAQSQHKRILIWGTGNTAKTVLKNGVMGEVIGFIHTYKQGTFELKPVYTPGQIDVEYDVICVASLYSDDIYEEIEFYHIPQSKVCYIYLPSECPIDCEINRTLAEQILSETNLDSITHQSWRTAGGFKRYDNQRERDRWVRRQLSRCEAGKSLLDAGAGEQRYKGYCRALKLKYVSQDICVYDGTGNGAGGQTGTWDTHEIDIISDIIDIPVAGKSFDYILCTEVFEHMMNPELAMKEFARILKSGGRLILTAPFTSWTHFAPYHYFTGINRYWYEEMCKKYQLHILEITANGNAFRLIQSECVQIADIYKKYTGNDVADSDLLLLKQVSHILDRMAEEDTASDEYCNAGYQLLIEKP